MAFTSGDDPRCRIYGAFVRGVTVHGWLRRASIAAALLATGCSADDNPGPALTNVASTASSPASAASVGSTTTSAPPIVRSAGIVDPVPLANVSELLEWVDDIVIGTVVDVGPAEAAPPQPGQGSIGTLSTPVTVEVSRVVLGDSAPGQRITYTKYGGVIPGLVEETMGAAIPEEGQELMALSAVKPWDTHAFFDFVTIEDGRLGYDGEKYESAMQFAFGTPLEQFISDIESADVMPGVTAPTESSLVDHTTLPVTDG